MITAQERSRAALRPCWAVLALTVAALVLRATGIAWLLPEEMNPDGLDILLQVERFRGARANYDWWYSSYPHLFARIAACLPVDVPPAGEVLSLERHLELARSPWVRMRLLSVLLSSLAIPATYLLARRFLGRAAALIACGLIATSLLHISQSIQEKPHAAGTSCALLALLAALRLRRRPDVRAYLLCGLTAFVAVGMLHNAAICVPAIAVAFFARDRKAPGASRASQASAAWILVPIAAVALSVVVFYPFFFEQIEYPQPAKLALTSTGLGEFATRILGRFHGAPCWSLLRAAFELDPVLIGAGAGGILIWIAAALRDRRRFARALGGDLAVVLAYTLPYLLVLGLFRDTLVRFALPILPVLACAAGLAFERASTGCSARFASARLRRACPAVLGTALLALTAWPAWHFARIRCRPSPMSEAAGWIAEHVEPSAVVVVVPLRDLALLPTDEALAENVRREDPTIWSRYVAKTPAEAFVGVRRPILVEPGGRPDARHQLQEDPLSYLRRWSARYVVLDLSGGGQDLLREGASRVARFSPARVDDGRGRGVTLWGTGYDRLRPTALGILGLRTFGTTVEVYRLP